MTKERIIEKALKIGGRLWQAYGEVPDPSFRRCERGDVETRKWADETSVEPRKALGGLMVRALELAQARGVDADDFEAVTVVAHVQALEIGILLYISRGGAQRWIELVTAWGKVSHYIQRWEVSIT